MGMSCNTNDVCGSVSCRLRHLVELVQSPDFSSPDEDEIEIVVSSLAIDRQKFNLQTPSYGKLIESHLGFDESHSSTERRSKIGSAT